MLPSCFVFALRMLNIIAIRLKAAGCPARSDPVYLIVFRLVSFIDDMPANFE